MTRTAKSNLELIALLGFFVAVGPLSIDTYLPSLPAIAHELGTDSNTVQLSVSSFFFGLAGGQLICGPLSDRFGRRPLIFIGFAIFLVASIACALATEIYPLIAARAAQGLAASASLASGRAVIRDVWSGDKAARAMSFVVMIMSIAPLAAPILGGQLLVFFGWRSIFWMLSLFGLAAIALAIFRLPETNGPERRSGVSLADYFRAYGVVLQDARVWGYLLCGGLSSATMFAYLTGIPFLYIGRFDIDPSYFGFLFGVNVIGLTAGNWINSRYVVRVGYRRMLGCGVGVTILGTLGFLGLVLSGLHNLTAIVVALLIAITPISMVMANATTGMLNLYPKNAGAASALFGVSQFGCGAIVGTLVSALYDGTPFAMSGVMVITALGSALAYLWLRRLTRTDIREIEPGMS